MVGDEKTNDPEFPNHKASANLEFSPLVSVITPVLNGKKYLERCIQSVLNQSYPHVEHVFVDGGSSDGSLDILRRYNERSPQRIRLMTGTDRNAEDAWNKGLLLSRGDILGWLGADDTYTPDAVRTVVEFFQSNPGASFVFGLCNVIDEHDRLMTQVGTKDFDLEETINRDCQVAAPSAFYKREVVAKVGLLDISLPPGDFEYWLRIAKAFPIHRIQAVLANFRHHPGGTTGSPRIQKRYAYVTYKISRRYGGRIFSPRGQWYFAQVLRARLGPLYPWVKWLGKRVIRDKR